MTVGEGQPEDAGALDRLQVGVEVDGPVVVVRVAGVIDTDTAPSFDRTLQFALGEGAEIVVDLSAVPSMDPRGVEVLMAASQRATGSHRRLTLRQPQDQVRRTLDDLALGDALPVEDDGP